MQYFVGTTSCIDDYFRGESTDKEFFSLEEAVAYFKAVMELKTEDELRPFCSDPKGPIKDYFPSGDDPEDFCECYISVVLYDENGSNDGYMSDGYLIYGTIGYDLYSDGTIKWTNAGSDIAEDIAEEFGEKMAEYVRRLWENE